MGNIARRNPDTYRHNPYYTSLSSAVTAYRDALAQIEREGVNRQDLLLSR